MARWQVARWPGDRWQVGQKKNNRQVGYHRKELTKRVTKKTLPEVAIPKKKFMKRPTSHTWNI